MAYAPKNGASNARRPNKVNFDLTRRTVRPSEGESQGELKGFGLERHKL